MIPCIHQLVSASPELRPSQLFLLWEQLSGITYTVMKQSFVILFLIQLYYLICLHTVLTFTFLLILFDYT